MTHYTFHCKVLTHMFMNRIKVAKPELRTDSFKGILRRTWRQVNGHLPGVASQQLEKMESTIFGGSDQKVGRSKVVVEIEADPIDFQNYSLLSHRKVRKEGRDSPALSIPPGTTFRLHLKLLKLVHCDQKDEKGRELVLMDEKRLFNLFVLATFISGFGKRGRRGYGSINITKVLENGQELDDFNPPDSYEALLDVIDSVFVETKEPGQSFYNIDDQEGCIRSRLKTKRRPNIESIHILEPKKRRHIIDQIGMVSSMLLADHGQNYQRTLGAGKPRFASPLMVSLIPGPGDLYRPVVAKLATIPPGKRRDNPDANPKQTLFEEFINGLKAPYKKTEADYIKAGKTINKSQWQNRHRKR